VAGNDLNTVLLLHANGANGSTSFPDDALGSDGKAISVYGNAQVSTAQFKFGSGSLYLDGSGDTLAAAAHADFDFGTSPFTWDCWVRFSATGRVYLAELAGNTAALAITPSSGLIEVYAASLGYVIYGGSTPFNTGQWYHIALVRNGSSWVLYRDGVSYATATNAGAWGSSVQSFIIGSANGGSYFFNGYIDEFRVSKGIARWTAGFTPPTEEYTTNGSVLVAEAATFALTASDAGVSPARNLPADTATFTWNGKDAALTAIRDLDAELATYALTVFDADIIGGKRLGADTADYVLTAWDAGIIAIRHMGADVAAFSWDANDATLAQSYLDLVADVADFTFTAWDAATIADLVILSDPAAYTLTVWNAELVRGRWLDADHAAYVWGGSDAALSKAQRRINMFPQTF